MCKTWRFLPPEDFAIFPANWLLMSVEARPPPDVGLGVCAVL